MFCLLDPSGVHATWHGGWFSILRRPCCFPHRLKAFEIVARPALDSFGSALDRVKMNIYLKFAEWGLPCPITGHTGSMAAESQPSQQP